MKEKIITILTFIFLIIILISLTIFYFFQPKVQLAGDIVEYYGITESLKNHLSFNLTKEDQKNLEKVLHPEYFSDPGYYILGTNENRYPVHFVFYSVLATPIRIIFETINLNPLLSLTFLNILIIFSTLSYLIFSNKNEVKDKNPHVLVILFFISPLIFFIPWPGPDIFYTMLLLLSIFYFINNKTLLSAIFATLASWHSQPLAIFSVIFTFYYFLTHKDIVNIYIFKKFTPKFLRPFLICVSIAIFLIIPYIFNFYAFRVLTPWTLFDNWWNQIYGFGIQNISIQRLYEQFFDLNVGIFWYAPILFVIGFYQLIKKVFIDPKYLVLLNTIFIASIFYQTNPAWHFGTAGYGPSRHIIFLVPILIILCYEFLQNFSNKEKVKILGLVIFSQIFLLSLNGFFLPNFENTLKHNQLSRFVLNNYPHYYNPSPEIFIDRTISNDFNYLSSAIFKNEKGVCKKAYILKHDQEKILNECGYIPEQYNEFFENDEYKIAKNFIRKVKTYGVVLSPKDKVCIEKCITTIQEIQKYIPEKEWSRISKHKDKNGFWEVSFGRPLELTIPINYEAKIYHTSGTYMNFY